MGLTVGENARAAFQPSLGLPKRLISFKLHTERCLFYGVKALICVKAPRAPAGTLAPYYSENLIPAPLAGIRLAGIRLQNNTQTAGSLFAGERFSSAGRYGLKPSRNTLNNFHLLPVIRKLFAAIKAANICAGQSGHFRAALTWFLGDREAEILVVTSEQHVKQTRHKSHPVWIWSNKNHPEAQLLPSKVYYRTMTYGTHKSYICRTLKIRFRAARKGSKLLFGNLAAQAPIWH
jgi:hypothetical protein